MGQTPDAQSACERLFRVVVISRPDAFNEYVLDRLVKVAQVEKLLRAVAPPHPPHTLSRAIQRFSAAPLATAGKPGRDEILRRLDARLNRRIAEHLPKSGSSIFASAEPIINSDLNGAVGIRLVSEIAPDLMVLSGAPVLKPAIFTLPRFGTVNVHWGIAPKYRGEQSMFNALRSGDYACVGATLHYLDEGIDTGAAVAQCWPALAPEDDLASLWAKTARLVAETLTEFVERLKLGPVSGQLLPGPGPLFRARDRRVLHYLNYNVRRSVKLETPPYTKERVLRYW